MERGGICHRFFYLSLLADEKGQSENPSQCHGVTIAGIRNLLARFGIGKFLAEVDESREFGRNGEGGIVGTCLKFASREGFRIFVNESEDEVKYRSAREFRERLLIEAIKSSGLGIM